MLLVAMAAIAVAISALLLVGKTKLQGVRVKRSLINTNRKLGEADIKGGEK